jgi:hypothetical protein
MRDRYKSRRSLKSARKEGVAGESSRLGGTFTGSRPFLAFLLAALCAAPAVLAQTPAGTSGPAQPKAAAQAPPQAATTETKQQGGISTQPEARTQANASSQAEPQMQDQSAPAGESLADAARKARAQKTKTGAPKLYTEDTVSKLSGHGVSVVGGSEESLDSSGAADSDVESQVQPSGGNQEQYWRSRTRTIRDQMAQLDQQITGIRAEIAKYGAVQIDPQSGAQAGVIYVKDRNAQISRIEQQKASLESQMDALEEEGRKAGADSGWFR